MYYKSLNKGSLSERGGAASRSSCDGESLGTRCGLWRLSRVHAEDRRASVVASFGSRNSHSTR